MTNTLGEGEVRVRFRNKRWWGLMLGSLGAILATSGILHSVFEPDQLVAGKPNPQFAIWASIFIVAITLIVGIIYHRIIDEQEEHAYLWGMTMGYYVLAPGSLVYWLLFNAGLIPASGFMFILLASALVAIAVQLRLQFR
jgi:hypothetical protein